MKNLKNNNLKYGVCGILLSIGVLTPVFAEDIVKNAVKSAKSYGLVNEQTLGKDQMPAEGQASGKDERQEKVQDLIADVPPIENFAEGMIDRELEYPDYQKYESDLEEMSFLQRQITLLELRNKFLALKQTEVNYGKSIWNTIDSIGMNKSVSDDFDSLEEDDIITSLPDDEVSVDIPVKKEVAVLPEAPIVPEIEIPEVIGIGGIGSDLRADLFVSTIGKINVAKGSVANGFKVKEIRMDSVVFEDDKKKKIVVRMTNYSPPRSRIDRVVRGAKLKKLLTLPNGKYSETNGKVEERTVKIRSIGHGQSVIK